MPKRNGPAEPVYVGCANPDGCPRTIRNLRWLIDRRGWIVTEDAKVFCPVHRGDQEEADAQWVTFSTKLRPYMTSALDEEAAELGISRIALIRVILSSHLEGRN